MYKICNWSDEQFVFGIAKFFNGRLIDIFKITILTGNAHQVGRPFKKAKHVELYIHGALINILRQLFIAACG